VEAAELITLEEFEQMPEENEYRVELVRGQVVREPLTGGRHGHLTHARRLLSDRARSRRRDRLAVESRGFAVLRPPAS